ncbi:substrate-binding periplasmic protein [Colwelliaceae bacterium 6441]
MGKISKYLLSILLGIPFFILAEEGINTDNSLKLIAGLSKPPFILEEKDKGLQLDLIRAALKQENISVNFTHMPLGRNITGFRRINADGIVTLPPDYVHPALFLSKPYISYQNVAVSLVENQFSINTLSDLSDKSIIAFQNAKKFLGDEYGLTVAYAMDYREVPEQKNQIELLFLRRAEVIILDINIFKYFIKNNSDGLFTKPFTVHYIFNERSYSAGFKSEKIRDAFDAGIQLMKENGTYQLIHDNYLN